MPLLCLLVRLLVQEGHLRKKTSWPPAQLGRRRLRQARRRGCNRCPTSHTTGTHTICRNSPAVYATTPLPTALAVPCHAPLPRTSCADLLRLLCSRSDLTMLLCLPNPRLAGRAPKVEVLDGVGAVLLFVPRLVLGVQP